MSDFTAAQQAFTRLLQIMKQLRVQCPWDRQQTLASLRHLTLEEAYELSEAILAEDKIEIKQELAMSGTWPTP